MIIDATNQETIDNYEYELRNLRLEKKNKGEYSASDIYLVRTTGFFPEDNFLPALCNIPFMFKNNSLVHDVVFDLLLEKEDNPNDYDIRTSLIEEAHQYDVYSTQYRSSVHFCLNGLVGNHAYGTFDTPFIIVEPFKYHENDNNILAVRGEDTYFKDGIKLSDEAVVLVPIEMKDQIGDNPSLNVVYYKGDRRKALDMYLVSQGIVPENVCSNYLSESDTSVLIDKYLSSHEYGRERHCFHPNYREDDEKSLKLWDHYAHMFYDYLFEEAYHDDNKRKEEKEILHGEVSYYASSKNSDTYRALRTVIDDIGLDRFKEIVINYNKIIEEKLEKGEIPTNNKLLGIEPVITRDSNGYGGI